MKHETRKKASNIGAVVGALVASAGSINTTSPYVILDMAIGGALWFGMVYGVCSLIIKVKGAK
jgi:hypothetical protein